MFTSVTSLLLMMLMAVVKCSAIIYAQQKEIVHEMTMYSLYICISHDAGYVL